LAVCIAWAETGGFSDKKLIRHHNWFGFKKNKRRLFTGLFGANYCHYPDVETMLRDYRLRESEICQQNGFRSEAELWGWVEHHYATDEDYANKLQQAKRSLF
jgi:hypothetical protein